MCAASCLHEIYFKVVFQNTVFIHICRCPGIYLLYKAEKPSLSVHPSVCTFWHDDNSAVSARIETGLARNESCVFEDHKVYF